MKDGRLPSWEIIHGTKPKILKFYHLERNIVQPKSTSSSSSSSAVCLNSLLLHPFQPYIAPNSSSKLHPLCQHKIDVNKFLQVGQYWHVHVLGVHKTSSLIMLYCHNHKDNDINHNSNTIHTQIQADSVVSDTNTLFNSWLQFMATRRETQFLLC